MRLQVHGAAEAALSAATAIARAGLAAGSPEPTELARKRPSMQLLPKLLELACCLRAAACLSIARSTNYDPTAAYFKVACRLMLVRSKLDDKILCCYVMWGLSFPLPSVPANAVTCRASQPEHPFQAQCLRWRLSAATPTHQHELHLKKMTGSPASGWPGCAQGFCSCVTDRPLPCSEGAAGRATGGGRQLDAHS